MKLIFAKIIFYTLQCGPLYTFSPLAQLLAVWEQTRCSLADYHFRLEVVPDFKKQSSVVSF